MGNRSSQRWTMSLETEEKMPGRLSVEVATLLPGSQPYTEQLLLMFLLNRWILTVMPTWELPRVSSADKVIHW